MPSEIALIGGPLDGQRRAYSENTPPRVLEWATHPESPVEAAAYSGGELLLPLFELAVMKYERCGLTPRCNIWVYEYAG